MCRVQNTENSIMTIAAILLLTLLQGCNSMVFIDEFLKETPEIVLSHSHSATVPFENGDWRILQVTAPNGIEYSGDIYDLEGNLIRDNTYNFGDIDSPLKFVHHKPGLAFSVTRPVEDRLIITLEESLRDEPLCIEIVVGNEWAGKRIQATMNPCRKYIIEKVEYDFTQMNYYNNNLDEKSTQAYRNNGDTPLYVILMPYQDTRREIHLDNLEDLSNHNSIISDADLMQFFGADRPTFEIPDIVDGKPVLKGTMVPFSTSVCELPTGLPEDKQVQVEIPSHSHIQVTCFLEMEIYSLPAKITAVNPDTGNHITYKAELNVEQPFGHWIWTVPVKEEAANE